MAAKDNNNVNLTNVIIKNNCVQNLGTAGKLQFHNHHFNSNHIKYLTAEATN